MLTEEIIDSVTYYNDNARGATDQLIEVILETRDRLRRNNLIISGVIADNGFESNVPRGLLRALAFYSVPSVSHVLTNVIRIVGLLRTITFRQNPPLNAVVVNIRALADLFSNHPDAVIEAIARRFWFALQVLSTGVSKCSLLRFETSIEVINNLRFLLDVQWPQLAQQNRLDQLELLIKFIENVQQAQILLEEPMNPVNERQMRGLAIYFMTTRSLVRRRQDDECLEQLTECLIYFSDIFLFCHFPFVPMQLGVSMLYCIKEKIRYFKRNNSLPSIDDFVSSLAEFRRDGLEEICFSEFYTMPINIIPTRPYLQDLFLSHSIQIDLNALVLLNNNVLLRYPTLANIALPILNVVMAILDQTRVHRNVRAPLIIANQAIIDAVIRVQQHSNL